MIFLFLRHLLAINRDDFAQIRFLLAVNRSDSKKKCNVIKREDLIGQYLGETTIKTMDTLDFCKNGVMLIDEAYSLGSSDNRDSYAKEAIDCINQYFQSTILCIKSQDMAKIWALSKLE